MTTRTMLSKARRWFAGNRRLGTALAEQRLSEQPMPPSPIDDGYVDYWKTQRGSYGERFVSDVCSQFTFDSVLDAGCGEGTVVRRFIDQSKQASGIELSTEALQHCDDLVQQGIVRQGSLTRLPFTDGQFDLVFSSEVLEHIPEQDVPDVASELCRVAKHTLFMTISLRPSSNHNAYHPTLKPRTWWEQQFIQQGFAVDRATVDRFQRRMSGATTRQVLEAGPTLSHIDEMDWFIDQGIVDFAGELEPWFFIFKKS